MATSCRFESGHRHQDMGCPIGASHIFMLVELKPMAVKQNTGKKNLPCIDTTVSARVGVFISFLLRGNALFYYSTNPYLTFMRSNFSSIGSAAIKIKTTVAAAWIKSIGRPDM